LNVRQVKKRKQHNVQAGREGPPQVSIRLIPLLGAFVLGAVLGFFSSFISPVTGQGRFDAPLAVGSAAIGGFLLVAWWIFRQRRVRRQTHK
jgi:hypothetical protein